MDGNIEFIAVYGDVTKKVTLTRMLTGHYQINIGGGYYGIIVYRERRWEVLLQNPIAKNFEEQISADDIQILREIVAEHNVIDDPVDRAYYDRLLLRFYS
jgi:hypothetical protein